MKQPYSPEKENYPFQPTVALQIETGYSFCRAIKMTGFYMKRNSGLKWVKKQSSEV